MFAENILFFTNQQKILKFMLANSGEKYYDSQISLLSGVSRAGANCALRELASSGLIQSERKGNMNFYHIDPGNEMIKQLQVMLAMAVINELVMKAKGDCSRIVLYGSAARGENSKGRYINLLFITAEKTKVNDMHMQSHNIAKILPVIVTQDEFTKMQNDDAIFGKEINEGKVIWNKPEITQK